MRLPPPPSQGGASSGFATGRNWVQRQGSAPCVIRVMGPVLDYSSSRCIRNYRGLTQDSVNFSPLTNCGHRRFRTGRSATFALCLCNHHLRRVSNPPSPGPRAGHRSQRSFKVSFRYRKLERVNGIDPSSQRWQRRALPLSCTRKIGVTNRTRTGTNAFTGRDAAITSWPPFGIGVRGRNPTFDLELRKLALYVTELRELQTGP